jgi:hypothetical protein
MALLTPSIQLKQEDPFRQSWLDADITENGIWQALVAM